ncbi:MAG TPA: hypothetical protein VIC84_03635 [Blastocatellia bacterium]|jgi:hypothetical protein
MTARNIARVPRFLLAFSSLLLVVGGAVHAAAFNLPLAATAKFHLDPFIGGSFKLLWLADSTTMFILAAVFGLIAARPSVATRLLVTLLSLIPAATAVLVYVFLGGFFAGHLLMATAAAAFFAGLQFPGARVEADGQPTTGLSDAARRQGRD